MIHNITLWHISDPQYLIVSYQWPTISDCVVSVTHNIWLCCVSEPHCLIVSCQWTTIFDCDMAVIHNICLRLSMSHNIWLSSVGGYGAIMNVNIFHVLSSYTCLLTCIMFYQDSSIFKYFICHRPFRGMGNRNISYEK